MFTQNFIEYTKMWFLGGTSSYQFTSPAGSTVNVTPSNNLMDNSLGYIMQLGQCKNIPVEPETMSYNSAGVYFGQGTTPAKLEDKTLEIPVTNGLSITNPAQVTSENDAGIYRFNAVFNVKNTSEEDITISEVGLFKQLKTSSSSGYHFLMERTVLEEPIILNPNTSKLISYQISFNHR